MKVIFRSTWRGLRQVGNVALCVATFFLWSAIAAGAGWVLVHLPEVWYAHLEEQNSTRFAVAAVTSYGIVAGLIFLAFSSGALQMLADAYTGIRAIARARRSQRAVSTGQRQRLAM